MRAGTHSQVRPSCAFTSERCQRSRVIVNPLAVMLYEPRFARAYFASYIYRALRARITLKQTNRVNE